MYEEFFGLTVKPFNKTPDPKFLYEGSIHREAFARMQHAVEERELMLLTGEIGSGKTTLSRALMDSLDEGYRTVFIVNPTLPPAQLLRVIARGIGVKTPSHLKTDLLQQIYDTLFSLYENGICPVIIIDEAQLIPGRSSFEEIRLLTNFQLDDLNLFSLIIMGQPELRKRLSSRSYRALAQRIGFTYHLVPLSLGETREYIDFRVRVAGRDELLFTEEASTEIYRLSKGIPRVINSLASHALLEGFGQDTDPISPDIILSVAREMGEWVVKEKSA
ncbi:MAG: ExeA family protein [Thermodesulfobacteriota bacterium]